GRGEVEARPAHLHAALHVLRRQCGDERHPHGLGEEPRQVSRPARAARCDAFLRQRRAEVRQGTIGNLARGHTRFRRPDFLREARSSRNTAASRWARFSSSTTTVPSFSLFSDSASRFVDPTAVMRSSTTMNFECIIVGPYSYALTPAPTS